MNQPDKQPKWLTETQNNSWNPELLISGISILFIFTVVDYLEGFAIGVIQDYGVNPTFVYFILIYVAVALQALKYAFVFHLVMRGLWIGLVGLNYVFPNGIVKEKLPRMNQKKFFLDDLSDNVTNIMKVERICSSIFSIAFTLVGISAWIMLFIIPAAIINAVGVDIKWVGLIVLIFVVFISFLFPLHHQLSRWLGKESIPWLKFIVMAVSRSQKMLFFRESMLIYQTNWNRNVAMAMFFLGALGISISTNIAGTARFINDMLPEPELIPGFVLERPIREYQQRDMRHYDEFLNDGERIQKASIPSYLIADGYLEIFQAGFGWDEEILKADTTLAVDKLLRTTINGEEAEVEWMKTNHRKTGQEGWVAYFDISDLPKGKNVLEFDKWVWHFHNLQPVYFEDWCVISFIKE